LLSDVFPKDVFPKEVIELVGLKLAYGEGETSGEETV